MQGEKINNFTSDPDRIKEVEAIEACYLIMRENEIVITHQS